MAKKILIIDDSSVIREQVRAALDPAGYEIVEARDGEEALAQLKAHPDTAMALCDVNMPRMNGLEMLEGAAAGGVSQLPPVVMLTTEGAYPLVQRARKAGAKGWIVKPFKPELLLATVKKLAGDA